MGRKGARGADDWLCALADRPDSRLHPRARVSRRSHHPARDGCAHGQAHSGSGDGRLSRASRGHVAKRQAQALVLRDSDRARLAARRVPDRPRGGQAAGVNRRKQTIPVRIASGGDFSYQSLLLLCEVLLFPVGGDAAHELQRQRLIQRKLHRALAEFVCGELFRKGRDSVRAGVKADVALVACEVDDIALEVKRRDAVGDLLRGFGDDFEDRVAHLIEFFLHLRRVLEDVVSDGGRGSVEHRFLPPLKVILV